VIQTTSSGTNTTSQSGLSEIFEAQGLHLLLTLSGCSAELLNDEPALQALVQEAATATGAIIMQICSHRFSPQGVTVVAVLAESHASLHTYPESGVVFWDCFTCGHRCRPQDSVDLLVKALQPASINQQVITRG
jgi:S-adenosylmethionine decarboxylase